jgi:glycosyltransferase involved in cell wall biosynthesis
VWVIVPAKDEESTIGQVARELASGDWVVLVVDDGSSDDTGANAEAAGATVLRHAVNLGQGAALQTGFDYACESGAEVIVTFDADGQHDPDDIPVLLEALEAGADVALGSRFLGAVTGVSPVRRLFLRAAVMASNRMSGMSLSDAHCGIRAIRAPVADRLRLTQGRMAHASEFLGKLRRADLVVVEVPVSVRYTDYSKSKGQGLTQALRILFDFVFNRST